MTIKQDLRRFFQILETQEESDGGNVFNPTYISCCRALIVPELDGILKRLKEYGETSTEV